MWERPLEIKGTESEDGLYLIISVRVHTRLNDSIESKEKEMYKKLVEGYEFLSDLKIADTDRNQFGEIYEDPCELTYLANSIVTVHYNITDVLGLRDIKPHLFL